MTTRGINSKSGEQSSSKSFEKPLTRIFWMVWTRGNDGKCGNGATFGKSGKFADKYHNQLILSRLVVLELYCFRSKIVYYRYLLCTIVRVLGGLRGLRVLGGLGGLEGLSVRDGKTIKERLCAGEDSECGKERKWQ